MGGMRSIWKGSIAFGLVNVPVKVYSATEDHDIRFHQVHAKDGGRIKYNRVCSECGNTVQFADIDKAYDSEDGSRVILSDEDFNKLPAAEKHEIPVLEFVPNDQIDPILFEKSYFLEPDSASPKAYVLLSTVLTESDRTALVHFTLRQKTRLAAMRARDGVLVIQTLLWPDEVRAAEFPSLDDVEKPKAKELKMAQTLVESMAGDFDPTEFTDDYQLQLRQLLDEMIENGGKKVIPAAEVDQEGTDAEVVDLVAALQRSVDEAKSNASKAGSSKSTTPRKKRA
ncbi:Ku protein [Rhodococcus qingshengii]|jgi:DNA end-binding protein Ku|uniref:Non-homologous end joining protein Ku n=4 Tax=Nocardiaceae TaxID=85025 RepID=A0A0C3AA26_RHOER|nr:MULTISPECIES: Ku protein [Rhodococcus]MCD2156006.1 Ku protein [Rhodococcus cerastii]NHE67314.1 Ku protein [Rhodococcus sp. D-46]OCC19872.1 Ku protein [Prescottella equi]AGT92661.1 DNA end-binding protein Ku [Rhodococcus erythropolis CCM2595]AKD97761.1 DNA repair protein [Rhodococcus erythropolis]